MAALSYNRVQIFGPITLASVIDLEMSVRPNQHGVIRITGLVSRETAFGEVGLGLSGAALRILADGVPLFHGFIVEVKIDECNGCYYAEIFALSGTYRFDQLPRCRSFEDSPLTCAELVQKIVAQTDGAAVCCTAGQGRPIEPPLVQDRETDWALFKRLAARLGSVLVPDCRNGTTFFWFGMRESLDEHRLSDSDYTARAFPPFCRAASVPLRDPLYYQVRDPGNYRIGDTAFFRGNPYLICGQQARLERGELIFTYTLARKAPPEAETFYSIPTQPLQIPS